MRMVPVCTGLVGSVKLVQERVAGYDGALCDAGRTVSPCAASLEESVPMLLRSMMSPRKEPRKREMHTDHTSREVHGIVVEVVDNVQAELVTLNSTDDRARHGE